MEMEKVAPSQLDLDEIVRLSREGKPFVIVHGRGKTQWFLAFPCFFARDSIPILVSLEYIEEIVANLKKLIVGDEK